MPPSYTEKGRPDRAEGADLRRRTGSQAEISLFPIAGPIGHKCEIRNETGAAKLEPEMHYSHAEGRWESAARYNTH